MSKLNSSTDYKALHAKAHEDLALMIASMGGDVDREPPSRGARADESIQHYAKPETLSTLQEQLKEEGFTRVNNKSFIEAIQAINEYQEGNLELNSTPEQIEAAIQTLAFKIHHAVLSYDMHRTNEHAEIWANDDLAELPLWVYAKSL